MDSLFVYPDDLPSELREKVEAMRERELSFVIDFNCIQFIRENGDIYAPQIQIFFGSSGYITLRDDDGRLLSEIFRFFIDKWKAVKNEHKTVASIV